MATNKKLLAPNLRMYGKTPETNKNNKNNKMVGMGLAGELDTGFMSRRPHSRTCVPNCRTPAPLLCQLFNFVIFVIFVSFGRFAPYIRKIGANKKLLVAQILDTFARNGH